jgi:transposase
MFITDAQWEELKPILEPKSERVLGRPRTSAREVFEALLFVLHTGMQWKFLPATFPPKSTVHDYLKKWCQQDRFRAVFAQVIRQRVEAGTIDLHQCFIDATFAPAKGGGNGIGLTKKGKGSKVQLIIDAQGVPLAMSVASANTGETAMVQETLALLEEETPVTRLIGDKGYDSDPLDQTLADLGIEMIAPNRINRRPENQTQDGRPLRRYKHRWKVERTIAWLGYHRRLLVRWEKHLSLFAGFAWLGCLMIALKA